MPEERPLLSAKFQIGDGRKGRNFYVEGVGFGRIYERDQSRGNIFVEFQDVGHSAITGVGYEYEYDVIADEEETAHLIELTTGFVRPKHEAYPVSGEI
jgi:hypothetical protein